MAPPNTLNQSPTESLRQGQYLAQPYSHFTSTSLTLIESFLSRLIYFRPPSAPSPALSLLRNLPSFTPTLCFCHVVICASCSRFWQSPVVAHRKRFPRGVFKKKESLRQITRRPQPANGVQTSCQTTYYGLAPQTTQHNANSLHEFWPLPTPQLISLQQKQQTENLSDQAGLTKKQKNAEEIFSP